MSNAPRAVVISRAASRYGWPSGTAPAIPCTGSRINAAVVSSTALASAAALPRGTKSTSNGFRGKPYQRSERQETAAAAAVRPWNAPSIATTGAAGLAKGEAERVLVGLGAAVDQERLVEALGREVDERFGGAGAGEVRHDVRLERHLPCLPRDRFGPARVAVAQKHDGVPAVEVEQAAPRSLDQPDSFTAHRLEVEMLVDRQQIARLERRGALGDVRIEQGALLRFSGDHRSVPLL